jgi:hypothetical protein
MFVFQSEINKGEMPKSSENSETDLNINPDISKNHQDATSDPDLPENSKKDSKLNPDRTKIDEDVADDFVRALLHSYRKIRKSCRSKNEKDRHCKILEIDQDDLKLKFLQELSNLNT